VEVVEPAGGAVREGSLTMVGAVSPPGGDFSEPVVTHTKRFVRAFWGLDRDLASARHFPSIHWNTSYSEYDVSAWYAERAELPWSELRRRATDLLKEDDRLQNIVKLIGPDALPDRQRVVLETARMIKEAFLQQGAFSAVDSYCPIEKQLGMMDVILSFHDGAQKALASGRPVFEIMSAPVVERIFRMKEEVGADQAADRLAQLKKQVSDSLAD